MQPLTRGEFKDERSGIPPTGEARRIPREHPLDPGQRRMKRLARIAWILDRSIPIGRWRIGLDPILGLLPGVGDWLGAMASVYILYEGARLGAPSPLLLRMAGNILVETVIGAVPVLGDLFDFAWQANMRNLALLQGHYLPNWNPRPLRAVWVTVLILALLVLAIIVVLSYLIIKAVAALFT